MNICPKAVLLAAAATGMLAACGDEAAPEQADDGRLAAGEVLEGSISDEMLPYGSLRSRPPLAEISDIPESEGGPPPAAAASAEGEQAPAGDAVPAANAEGEPSEPEDSAPSD